MTTLSDPPRESFRLSMLINDTRYRAYTFQFIALMLVLALFAYLGSNLVANLRAAGLNISYEFLGESSNYDINQTLIDYTSQSSHLRASIVGVLNTLLVAFLACVTATIIGVIAGVARLSPNWLVRKLMAGYVEAFRNVPVLIWIIIIFTIMTAVLPAPSAFRGEDPDASMLFGAVAFTNRGLYLPAPIWGPGSLVVVLVFIASIVGVFAYRRYATKLLYDTGKLLPMGWPSLAIFILPTLLVYFLLGRPITLEYPELAGFNFQGGTQILGSLIALWWALAIYTGAFIAENVRAGIQAVSKGQTEAAASLAAFSSGLCSDPQAATASAKTRMEVRINLSRTHFQSTLPRAWLNLALHARERFEALREFGSISRIENDRQSPTLRSQIAGPNIPTIA